MSSPCSVAHFQAYIDMPMQRHERERGPRSHTDTQHTERLIRQSRIVETQDAERLGSRRFNTKPHAAQPTITTIQYM